MTDSTKGNATGQGGVGAEGGQPSTGFQNKQGANHTLPMRAAANLTQAERDAKAISSRSTSNESQIAKLIALLRQGPQTTHYLRLHGISHPGGRVNDLRNRDYEIHTIRVRTMDAHGFVHINVAQYVLMKEPPRQMSFDERTAA